MAGEMRKRLLCLTIVLAFASLDYASEVQELSEAEVWSHLLLPPKQGGGGLRDISSASVVQLRDRERLGETASPVPQGNPRHRVGKHGVLGEATSTGTNCHDVEFSTGDGDGDGSTEAKVFSSGEWVQVQCATKGKSCVMNVCANRLEIKVGGDNWKFTAKQDNLVIAEDRSLTGAAEAFPWQKSGNGCAKITFKTGQQPYQDGGDAGGDGSTQVKMATPDGYVDLGPECTEIGATCEQAVCTETLRIKVGSDGWKFSAFQGSKKITPEVMVKGGEKVFTIEQGSAAATSQGKDDDEEPKDSPPEEVDQILPDAAPKFTKEQGTVPGKAAGSSAHKTPNDTPNDETADQNKEDSPPPPGADSGLPGGSGQQVDIASEMPLAPDHIDNSEGMGGDRKAMQAEAAGSASAKEEEDKEPEGTGPMPTDSPAPPGQRARDAPPPPRPPDPGRDKGAAPPDTSPRGADVSPLVHSVSDIIVANGMDPHHPVKKGKRVEASEKQEVEQNAEIEGPEKRLNKGDRKIGSKIDRIFIMNGHEHMTGSAFHEPPQEEQPDGAGSAIGSTSPYFARRRRTLGPVVHEPYWYGRAGSGSGSANFRPEGLDDLVHDTVKPAPSDGMPVGADKWREYRTPDGKTFYRNELTGTVQWHRPKGDIEIVSPLPPAGSGSAQDDESFVEAVPMGSAKSAGGSASFERPDGEGSGSGSGATEPTVTQEFQTYPYEDDDKVVKACCDGPDQWNFLDLAGDGKNGLRATKEGCEEKCRGTAGCKFFSLNPSEISSWCSGYEACDKQCDVDWKMPQTIFKLGSKSAPPSGTMKIPPPTFKKHAGKQCTGSADDVVEELDTSSSEECKTKCNELDKCSGFVLPTSGHWKNKCTLRAGKLTISEGKFQGDDRDCFEKVLPILPWKYEKIEGQQCVGKFGDKLRDFQAGKDEHPAPCEKKCSELGDECAGFVHILDGSEKGMCHLRKGTIEVKGPSKSDLRDCYKKVPNENIGKAQGSGLAASPLPLHISGATGGFENDNGGTDSNGDYVYAGKHNGKPMYEKAGSDFVLRWEEAAMGDWGAVNLGGNKNIWAVIGNGHHRFFVPSDDETPPASGWTARSTAAQGTIRVETAMSSGSGSGSVSGSNSTASGSGKFLPPADVHKLTVTGASGICGTKANGLYEPFDSSSGKSMYKNADGFLLQFESTVNGDWAAEHIGKNKDVWVVKTPDGKYPFYNLKADGAAPAKWGWQLNKDVECAEGVLIVSETPSAQAPAPTEVTVSGGQGGFEGDTGGTDANGKYVADGNYNNMAKYKNENGCTMRHDTVENQDWAALNLANNKDCWVVKCSNHDRYFVASNANTPPTSGWSNRDGTATGSISVETGISTPSAITINGLTGGFNGDEGGKLSNGVYEANGYHNGKPQYKNDAGSIMKYEDVGKEDDAAVNLAGGKNVWVIGKDGHYRAFAISDSSVAPTIGWAPVSGKAEASESGITACEGRECSVSGGAPAQSVSGTGSGNVTAGSGNTTAGGGSGSGSAHAPASTANPDASKNKWECKVPEDPEEEEKEADWEKKSSTYCSGNWGSDWAARTRKSVVDCQASCKASPVCTSITHGAYGGIADNCVLCTSKKTHGASWTTTYTNRNARSSRWEESTHQYCSGNWGSDWAARSQKSVADCQESCKKSPTCKGITHGAYGSEKHNCVLCTSSILSPTTSFTSYRHMDKEATCPSRWEEKPKKYCSGNWGSDWAGRTQKSVAECFEDCKASPTCKGIAHGAYGSQKHNCVLCTSDKLSDTNNFISFTHKEPPDSKFDEKPGKYCSGNWGSDWALRTQKSVSECQASCDASKTCKGITHGSYSSQSHNCVLCTSDKLSDTSNFITYPYKEPKAQTWEEAPQKYCSSNWNSDWAARTQKTVAECQASCKASPNCKGITHGKYGSQDKNCVLCTSDMTLSDTSNFISFTQKET